MQHSLMEGPGAHAPVSEASKRLNQTCRLDLSVPSAIPTYVEAFQLEVQLLGVDKMKALYFFLVQSSIALLMSLPLETEGWLLYLELGLML